MNLHKLFKKVGELGGNYIAKYCICFFKKLIHLPRFCVEALSGIGTGILEAISPTHMHDMTPNNHSSKIQYTQILAKKV